MQKTIFSLLAVSLLGVFSNVSHAQIEGTQYDWTLKLDKKGIQVFTSPVDGSKFKAVRAVMHIDGSIDRLIGLVSDSSACPEWADLCKEERVLSTASETESIVYTYNDIPFPVKDRDVVARVVWSFDESAQKASMTSTAIEHNLPATKAVRIQDAVAQWHFTQQDADQVLVENFAHIDPNGPTPAWLTNLLLTDSPYKTLLAMKKLVNTGRYDEFVPWFRSAP